MAILSVSKELPPSPICLRQADEEECLAGGVTGEQALRYSARVSDYFDAVYVDGEFAAAWGYRAESLFSYRANAWLLTAPPCERVAPVVFARIGVRVIKMLLSKFEEVEVTVHKNHHLSRIWLKRLGFKTIARNKDFMFMAITRETSLWVS